MAIEDSKWTALSAITGKTTSIEDMEWAWLASLCSGYTNSIPDMWREFLRTLGYVKTSLADNQYDWLKVVTGVTADLNTMFNAYWALAPAWAQQVLDTGAANAAQWTLSGSGIGTSAVTGGVVQLTTTTNAYFIRPWTTAEPMEAGVYQVTYTISSYVNGTISITYSTSSALTAGTNGTARNANGTYTETIIATAAGYIGFRGRGTSEVNNMRLDNVTIKRIA